MNLGDRTLQKYFYIAVGGALGSLARYGLGVFVTDRIGGKFPYGTFIINITACFIIGFSLAFLGRRTDLSAAWRFLIPVGFVGAYSTFSTFEWETFAKLQSGSVSVASLYVLSSVLIGLIAVWCGVIFARVFA